MDTTSPSMQYSTSCQVEHFFSGPVSWAASPCMWAATRVLYGPRVGHSHTHFILPCWGNGKRQHPSTSPTCSSLLSNTREQVEQHIRSDISGIPRALSSPLSATGFSERGGGAQGRCATSTGEGQRATGQTDHPKVWLEQRIRNQDSCICS